MSTHNVGGATMRGVLLDASHGTPPGVVEVSRLSDTSMSKVGQVTGMPTAGTEEVDETWQRLQKRAEVKSVKAKGKGVGDGDSVPVHCSLRAVDSRAGYDSEGDDAALDAVWGFRFSC